MDRDYEERKHAVSNSELSSDQDSFVSAVEVCFLSHDCQLTIMLLGLYICVFKQISDLKCFGLDA